MNYIELINQFWKTRRSVKFSSNESDLYYFLLQESNSRSWENPFECSNGLICASIGLTEKTLIDVRNRLQQKGLIEFEAGQKKRKSPVYTLLYCKNVSITTSITGSKTVGITGSKTVNSLINKTETKQNQTKLLLLEKEAKSVRSENESLRQQLKEAKTLLSKAGERKEKSSAKKEKKEISSNSAEVIAYLNEVCMRDFKPVESNARHINARLAEGYTVEDLKKVVEMKFAQWHKDPKMSEFLRPGTLFNSEKFQSYHNQVKAFEKNPQLMNDARKQFTGQNTGGSKQTHASAADLINASYDLFST